MFGFASRRGLGAEGSTTADHAVTSVEGATSTQHPGHSAASASASPPTGTAVTRSPPRRDESATSDGPTTGRERGSRAAAASTAAAATARFQSPVVMSPNTVPSLVAAHAEGAAFVRVPPSPEDAEDDPTAMQPTHGDDECKAAKQERARLLPSPAALARSLWHVLFSVKGLVLVTLVFQNCAAVLLTRYTRVRPRPSGMPMFSVTSAVMTTEMIKIAVCFLWVLLTEFPLSSSSGGEAGESTTTSMAPLQAMASVAVRLLRSPRALLAQSAFALRASLLNRDVWHMAPPAVLFTFQSNILYVALENVEVTVFQVLYQTKLLLTAVLVSFIFRRTFSRLRWLALVALFAGVVISQLDGAPKRTPPTPLSPAEAAAEAAAEAERFKGDLSLPTDLVWTTVAPPTAARRPATASDSSAMISAGNPLIGIIALLAASTSSAVAAVVMEKILKDPHTPHSLSVRNVQLGAYTLTLTGLVALYNYLSATAAMPASQTTSSSASSSQAAANGAVIVDEDWDFFAGFDAFVWLLVLTQAIGGIVVALVLKYADNILKGFATAISIVICGAVSTLVFDMVMGPAFLLGGTIVVASVFLYGAAK